MDNRLIFSVLLLITPWTIGLGQSEENVPDSLIIELSSFHAPYFVYKVRKKETIYHLSRSFQCSFDNLLSLNPDLSHSGLRENSIIKLPFDKDLMTRTPKSDLFTIPVYYPVKTGDNLYHLANRVFDLELSNLLLLNQLKSPSVKSGQWLLLGYYKLQKTVEIIPADDKTYFPQFNLPDSAVVEFTNQMRGIAVSQYADFGSGRLFALHNTAKMDTYIEIENPILNLKVMAKVIGRIPPIYERDVKIVVSTEVARQLGAVDKRFFVSLRYR